MAILSLPFQMAFEYQEHTPDCMTKTMLGNFYRAHIKRVDASDKSTREKFWTMIVAFYVSTCSYKCMSLPYTSISHKKLADTNLK